MTARTEAAEQRMQLDSEAEERQQQAQSLSEQLQSWANDHRAARDAAVEQTARRIEAQGLIVRERRDQ